MINIIKELRKRGGSAELSEILSLAESQEERAELELLALWMAKKGEVQLIERGERVVLRLGKRAAGRAQMETLDDVKQALKDHKYLVAAALPSSFAGRLPAGFGILDLRDAISYVINSANIVIRICSPFIDYAGVTFLAQDLYGAASRRVKVKLLTRESQGAEFQRAVKLLKGLYIRAGFEIGFEARSYLERYLGALIEGVHAKIVVADGEIAYVGSGELRAGSFVNNFEAGVLIKGKGVKSLIEMFDIMWQKATKVI